MFSEPDVGPCGKHGATLPLSIL